MTLVLHMLPSYVNFCAHKTNYYIIIIKTSDVDMYFVEKFLFILLQMKGFGALKRWDFNCKLG